MRCSILGTSRLVGALALLAATAQHALASPVQALVRRQDNPFEELKTVDHDKVEPIPETLSTDIHGKLVGKFKPMIYTKYGCVPFPAVDLNGGVSGGLKPTGRKEGGCRKSPGQVYVRWGISHRRYAIMFAYFMPKDQWDDGFVDKGHRYDWEHVVLWLDKGAADGVPVGMSYWTPDAVYDKRTGTHFGDPHSGDPPFNHPMVEYTGWKNKAHYFGDTGTAGGGDHAAVAWDQMPQVVRDALTNFDWGFADNFQMQTMPMVDSVFQANLDAAWDPMFGGY